MKTVGVLGGMGPQATMDFEQRFHREAQRHLPPLMNSGYPPLVVVYVRHLPMLWDREADRPVQPFAIDPRFLETARLLGSMADFLVIPSNAPHLFASQIEAAAGRNVLSMIDLTLEDLKRRGWRRVGVVGLAKPTVYTHPLTSMGIECEILPDSLRDALDRGIRAVMEGRDGEEHRGAASRALENLRGRGVEGVLLGCSEIPLLLGPSSDAPDLVNPVQGLAEAAVRAALDEGPI